MSTTVKRIMREIKDLKSEMSSQNEPPWVHAEPLSDNIFEWHFTIQGPPDTPYAGGLYHGRIVLPNEYPFKPPNLYMLTPNGRFQTNQKICLNVTGFHPEYWQPAWGIRTVLVALQGFFSVESDGSSIGSVAVPYSREERIELAKNSLSFSCSKCSREGEKSSTNLKIISSQFGIPVDSLCDASGNLLQADSNSMKAKKPTDSQVPELQFYIPRPSADDIQTSPSKPNIPEETVLPTQEHNVSSSSASTPTVQPSLNVPDKAPIVSTVSNRNGNGNSRKLSYIQPASTSSPVTNPVTPITPKLHENMNLNDLLLGALVFAILLWIPSYLFK